MLRSLDEYFRAAAAITLGTTTAPFVWLLMAFTSTFTLVVSLAVCCVMFYDVDDRALLAPIAAKAPPPPSLEVKSQQQQISAPTTADTKDSIQSHASTLADVAKYWDRDRHIYIIPHGVDLESLL